MIGKRGRRRKRMDSVVMVVEGHRRDSFVTLRFISDGHICHDINPSELDDA